MIRSLVQWPHVVVTSFIVVTVTRTITMRSLFQWRHAVIVSLVVSGMFAVGSMFHAWSHTVVVTPVVATVTAVTVASTFRSFLTVVVTSFCRCYGNHIVCRCHGNHFCCHCYGSHVFCCCYGNHYRLWNGHGWIYVLWSSGHLSRCYGNRRLGRIYVSRVPRSSSYFSLPFHENHRSDLFYRCRGSCCCLEKGHGLMILYRSGYFFCWCFVSLLWEFGRK